MPRAPGGPGRPLAALSASSARTHERLDMVLATQSAQSGAIAGLDSRTARLEQGAADAQASVEALADRAALLDKWPPASASTTASSGSGASRSGTDPHHVDSTVVRISAPMPVARSGVESALAPLAAEAGIPSAMVAMTGPGRGRTFHMQFAPTAEGMSAQIATQRMLDVRRDENGAWRPIAIEAGEGTAIRLYLDPDRSQAQRRIAFQVAPGLNCVPPRDSGSVGRRDMVSFTFDGKSRVVAAHWQVAAMAAEGLEVAPVEAAFRQELAAAPGRCPQRGEDPLAGRLLAGAGPNAMAPARGADGYGGCRRAC